ncbi:MAG: VWA domain-containing protein [Polyangiaceae bacterium]
MAKRLLRALVILAALAAMAFGVYRLTRKHVDVLPHSVADVEVVHAGVTVAQVDARGRTRASEGDSVATDADGRARVRLDDGTLLLMDRDTVVELAAEGVRLQKGRAFAFARGQGGARLNVGKAQVFAKDANVALQVEADGARVYSANEEITLSAAGREHKVRAGESAQLRGEEVQVVPEKAFDDWTGGLGAPYATTASSVGELWGTALDGPATAPASPLTLRSQEVNVEVLGEAAETKVVTTYFNGGSGAVRGDFRMALPESAIVSKVSFTQGGRETETHVALAQREQTTLRALTPLVEWAGSGWIRGSLPTIASGETVTVSITYVEWLPLRYDAKGRGRLQYRYPLAGGPDAPSIAELGITLDASAAEPEAIAAGMGATVQGAKVTLRRPDFRASADFVVDLVVPPFESKARMYVAADKDPAEPRTVLVRVDLPEPKPSEGASLVLVVDTSGSAEAGQLDVARSFVRAVLEALGPRDRVAVLAGDQQVAAVGPKDLGSVTPERRQAIDKALADLSPGGATHLAEMLSSAASLAADDPTAMVVYVGDGYATAGEANPDRILEQLARQPKGLPRLMAVGLGPVVNVSTLSALARGTGRYLSVQDSVEAAGAAISLVERALVPAVSNVAVDLGPDVEQVYPRTLSTVPLGQPFMLVGKLRGMAPSAAKVSYRQGSETKEDRMLLAWRTAPRTDDVARRWAQARVDDVLRSGKGREAVTDVALKVGLLTPWTGFHSVEASYMPSHPAVRMLTAETERDLGFGAQAVRGAVLTETLDDAAKAEGDYSAFVAGRVNARIDDAYREITACRNSRAAGRAEIGGTLRLQMSVDGDGRAEGVSVSAEGSPSDAALNECIELALGGLSYPQSGLATVVRIDYQIVLPPPKRTRAAKCTEVSKTALPFRRGVWQVRLTSEEPLQVYLSAKESCEVRTWADKRALLELMLAARRSGASRVALARDLTREGEPDAAEFVKKEAVRRAASPAELREVRAALLGSEVLPWTAFVKAYKAANGDASRLSTVRRFLTVAPHDPRLRGRLVALLESTGATAELLDEARRARSDAFAPAELLADIASALKRSKQDTQALRTFGEIAERAPFDPWARAFLGDRLMTEGLGEIATTHYSVLEQLAPDDPAVIVRLARAHALAGRLDVARRLLLRVLETGGRDGSAEMALLAGRLASVLVAEARGGKHSPETAATLKAQALELPRETSRVVLLVRAPGGEPALELSMTESGAAGKDVRPADVTAASAGLYAFSFGAQAEDVLLELQRPEQLTPARASSVKVTALRLGTDPGSLPEVKSVTVELPADGKPKEVKWRAGELSL